MDPVTLKMLTLLKSLATPAQLAACLADGAIEKSLMDVPGARPIDPVIDQFMHPSTQTTPPGEIPVGPPQAASGGGAARMTRTYSDPDPQMGITRAAEQLGRDVALLQDVIKAVNGLSASVKSHQNEFSILKSVVLSLAQSHEAMVKAQSSPATAAVSTAGNPPMGKADKEDKEEKEDKDDKKPFEKAVTALIEKANTLKATAEDSFTRASVATSVSKAGELRQAGVDALVKAAQTVVAARALDDDDLRPIRLFKALTGMAKAEDVKNQDIWPDEKRPGDDTPTAKADTAAAAPQHFVLDPSLKSSLEKALSGQGILSARIDQVMDTIQRAASGQLASTGPVSPPDSTALIKGDPEVVVLARMEEINTAVENGTINENQRYDALEIVSRMRAFAKGHVPEQAVIDMWNSTAEDVQGLFPEIQQRASAA